MEYRFSLTARLVALGAFALAALVALVFALGVVVGQRAALHAPVQESAPAPAAGEVRP